MSVHYGLPLLKHCLPLVCCYSSTSPPPPQLQRITSTPNYTCCNTSPPMLQVIQSTPGGVASRRGRGTGRRRLPLLSPPRQLSRSPSPRSPPQNPTENAQSTDNDDVIMASDSDQDICDTDHIPTQDDHSADSPIVGSFQVPVNLNESSLSLFDTTPYNAISVPSVPATFKVVSTGTTKQKPLLVSSDGFSYSVKTVRPTSTLWHCTKRSRQCPCKATVLQRNAEFSVGAHQHCHEPEPGVATVAQVRADVVAKTTQNIYASAAACVDVT